MVALDNIKTRRNLEMSWNSVSFVNTFCWSVRFVIVSLSSPETDTTDTFDAYAEPVKFARLQNTI